jgi:hypothetical protein
MASWKNGILAAAFVVAAVSAGAAPSKFDGVVQPSWANDHVVYEGDLLKLRLDTSSGNISASPFRGRFRLHLFRKAVLRLLTPPCCCIWVQQAGASRPRTGSCMARPPPI